MGIFSNLRERFFAISYPNVNPDAGYIILYNLRSREISNVTLTAFDEQNGKYSFSFEKYAGRQQENIELHQFLNDKGEPLKGRIKKVKIAFEGKKTETFTVTGAHFVFS